MKDKKTTKKKNKKTMKTKKRKAPSVVMPLAYTEDIGLDVGLKASRYRVSSEPTAAAANAEDSFRINVDKQEKRKRRQRMKRFVDHNGDSNGGGDAGSYDDDDDAVVVVAPPTALGGALAAPREGHRQRRPVLGSNSNSTTVVGTSAALEKPYLRLTAAPKPEDVRPLRILRKALRRVKARFLQTEDFEHANEQLKSIRQDITVQHLRDEFVLEVYETHARLLLEHGDLNEFNQCQAVIRTLTTTGGVGDGGEEEGEEQRGLNRRRTTKARDSREEGRQLRQSEEAADEFLAYRVLYDVVQNSHCDLIAHMAGCLVALSVRRSEGTEEEEKGAPTTTTMTTTLLPGAGPSLRHAVGVAKAVLLDDHVGFFRLYESAPHLSAYLMDYLVRRVRNAAYGRMMASYRPTLSTDRIRTALRFRDRDEAIRFLRKRGAVFVAPPDGNGDDGDGLSRIDCKAAYSFCSRSTSK